MNLKAKPHCAFPPCHETERRESQSGQQQCLRLHSGTKELNVGGGDLFGRSDVMM